MGIGNRIPDRTLVQQVNKKLAQAGAQTRITASASGGCITLTGTLEYETQRRIIVRKAQQVSGVGQVVDHMTVLKRKRSDQ